MESLNAMHNVEYYHLAFAPSPGAHALKQNMLDSGCDLLSSWLVILVPRRRHTIIALLESRPLYQCYFALC